MNGISAPPSGYPVFPLNELLSASFCPTAPLGAPSISGHNPFWDLPLLGRTRPYIEGVNCSQYHLWKSQFGTCLLWEAEPPF